MQAVLETDDDNRLAHCEWMRSQGVDPDWVSGLSPITFDRSGNELTMTYYEVVPAAARGRDGLNGQICRFLEGVAPPCDVCAVEGDSHVRKVRRVKAVSSLPPGVVL